MIGGMLQVTFSVSASFTVLTTRLIGCSCRLREDKVHARATSDRRYRTFCCVLVGSATKGSGVGAATRRARLLRQPLCQEVHVAGRSCSQYAWRQGVRIPALRASQ